MLSDRYISNRFLPDKAIDLMDEAASKLRMEMNSKPEELDTLDRKIRQIEIEIVAIKREKDKEKVAKLNEELNLKEERNTLFAQWSQEKTGWIKSNRSNKRSRTTNSKPIVPSGRLYHRCRIALWKDQKLLSKP